MRLAIAIALLLTTFGLGQSRRLGFEVASVKPAQKVGPISSSPTFFVAAGQSLKRLVGYAYQVRDYQIIDAPTWSESELWEIQATVPEGVSIPRPSTTLVELRESLTRPSPIALMLQSLLEERFQLKVHTEMRELPIYELSIGKGGSKMRAAEDQTPIEFGDRPDRPPNGPPTLTRGALSMMGGSDRRILEAKAVPLWYVLNFLVSELARPIVDKANLDDLYDVRLEWAPDILQTAPENRFSTTTLATALQEQLGLKLESTRGPVEVIVVDSVQRPSEN